MATIKPREFRSMRVSLRMFVILWSRGGISMIRASVGSGWIFLRTKNVLRRFFHQLGYHLRYSVAWYRQYIFLRGRRHKSLETTFSNLRSWKYHESILRNTDSKRFIRESQTFHRNYLEIHRDLEKFHLDF